MLRPGFAATFKCGGIATQAGGSLPSLKVAWPPLAGVVTTKIDEASSLGAIIDLVITGELALAGRFDLRRERVLPVSGTEMLANAKRLAKRSRDRKARQLQVAV